MMDHDSSLIKIVNDLKNKYDCHTIILYGSRARGDATTTADYDIIAIRLRGEIERDCRVFDSIYLDIFIYSEENIKNPDVSFVRMKDGVVLCQKDTIGDQLISKVKEIYQKGPEKIPDWEKQVIVTWYKKMLDRAKIGDIEGNFRRHWLLFDLLQTYFNMRDTWYLGPKESFQWLKNNDFEVFSLFDNALKTDATFDTMERLIEKVTKC